MAPPGPLTPSASALPLVVVASFPRSGTHVLIDLILNNFSPYRRRPLYVNLDEYLLKGLDVEDLIRTGGYVVKTHYPEPYFSSDNHEAYERVFANALLLAPLRSEEEIFRSFQNMVKSERNERMRKNHGIFWNYWSNKRVHSYLFHWLIDRSKTDWILDDLQQRLGIQRNARRVFPPDKHKRFKVYLRKLATRIFGNRLSAVNTTVGFNRTPPHRPQAGRIPTPVPASTVLRPDDR